MKRLKREGVRGLAMAQSDPYADGRVLRDQVRPQMPRYQDVVIDAGGHDSTTLRAALLLSDAVLVP
jgi:chromosome partitioning protein